METQVDRPMGKGNKKKQLPEFDKYYYYSEAVQSPGEDVKFFQRCYQESRQHLPKELKLREDFCSTAAICCEWVKLSENYTAVGIDLDPETLEYSRTNYIPDLNDDQKGRLELINDNVLADGLPKADITVATNFSYFIFKERETLKNYFTKAYESLKDDGLLILDCFGGSKCYEENEEETEHEDKGFSYFWDQESFDPITNNGQFFIHFKRKGEPKRERVFEYDWRLWSIPELRDILMEVGFKAVHVYWEGTDEDGEGDGEFSRATEGEECESWIAYIVGEK